MNVEIYQMPCQHIWIKSYIFLNLLIYFISQGSAVGTERHFVQGMKVGKELAEEVL